MSITFCKPLVWLLVLLLAFPLAPPGAAQNAQPPSYKPEEIEQLVAPIALYPDSLVSQILMASTYPLEIVEADRWAKQQKDQKSDAFAAALEKQSWDPSVKSLVNFPQVLSMMSEKLDVTQKLGDAFLAQQKDVLDAIQRLRAKAQKEGNLKTTKEQKVIVEQPAQTQTTVIKIEPANPQVVYVPTYNPTVVYGAWPYPAYPPYPYYPPGYVATTAVFSFAAGVAVGAAWGYAWGGCNWGRGDVDIDINRNVNINNTHINRQNYQRNLQARGINTSGQWQHDASHRKGVAYRDNATAQKFNRGSNAQAAKSREQFRGRAEQGRQQLAHDGGGLSARQGGAGERGAAKGSGGLGDRSGARDRGARDGELGNRSAQKGGLGERGGQIGDGGRGREAGAFEGVGRGGEARTASARGAHSRGGSGGGGARRGGGRRG
jgi:hypothetical protein